jgi:Zn-dependent protease with chaperone function
VQRGDVSSWVLGLLGATILIYFVAGIYLRRRATRDGDRLELALHRSIERTSWVFLAVCIAFFLIVAESRTALGPVLTSVLLYAIPVYWLVASVLGASRLEHRSRGLRSGVLRFSRFNLFSSFLMGGQTLPFLAAAFAAPVDPEAGPALAGWLALHVAIAIAIGLVLRRLVVRRLVRPRPFPDEAIEARVRKAAKKNGIRLNEILVVPHERGQSVNALAATTSRTIYVAEGLRDGLDRDELQAVLLHELAHFGQPLTNLIRNLSVPGLAAAIWLSRARWHLDLEENLVAGLAVLGFLVSGFVFVRFVCRRSESLADRFAEEWGTPGALARALKKLYSKNLRRRQLYDSRAATHPGLEHRLAALRDS